MEHMLKHAVWIEELLASVGRQEDAQRILLWLLGGAPRRVFVKLPEINALQPLPFGKPLLYTADVAGLTWLDGRVVGVVRPLAPAYALAASGKDWDRLPAIEAAHAALDGEYLINIRRPHDVSDDDMDLHATTCGGATVTINWERQACDFFTRIVNCKPGGDPMPMCTKAT